MDGIITAIPTVRHGLFCEIPQAAAWSALNKAQTTPTFVRVLVVLKKECVSTDLLVFVVVVFAFCCSDVMLLCAVQGLP